ncbi:MAG TPA: F0F1 ATP synthase subunit B [Gemmatimonadaceae bacterium]|nr:F0F1 ATP synthase subunit B [Gemmatimonadaceae bacterium]
MSFVNAALLLVQEHGPAAAADSPGLMSLRVNLMFYTLILFGITYFILRKYAFGAIFAAVEKREKALEDAIEGAKRDREEAARILAEHKRQIDESRAEAQRLIADGRAMGEKMRADLLEQTRREQADTLERARREIENEKMRAIAELRREAVDLAIAGASRVVEQNLDSQSNRKLVESYLASVGPISATSRR